MYGKLSSPLVLSDDYQRSIDLVYEYFSKNINDKSCRPSLFGKPIYVEAKEIIEERPVGFWHMISLEKNHHFAKVLPCTNDEVINKCAQNCNTHEKIATIKYGTEQRSICLYRASRIPWIIDIIKLADDGYSDVDVWLKPGNSSTSDKLYLRYNHDGADYVVVFSAERRFYRIISAFPVFYLSEKEGFGKDYKKYAWKYVKP